MIISPIQCTEKFLQNWVMVRPRITQYFGENPAIYKQFGLVGHNGADFGIPVGTQLFAPCDGVLTVGDEGTGGYGKYIKITKPNLEITLGHLSTIQVFNGDTVKMGEKIALSGNSGFSTGPHLHLTMKFKKDGKILDYDNGFKGAVDPLPYLITWKGGFINQTI